MTRPGTLCLMHRATYAKRFNAKAIKRPKPPAPPLTDKQFEAFLSGLSPLAQSVHRAARDFSRAMHSLSVVSFNPTHK